MSSVVSGTMRVDGLRMSWGIGFLSRSNRGDTWWARQVSSLAKCAQPSVWAGIDSCWLTPASTIYRDQLCMGATTRSLLSSGTGEAATGPKQATVVGGPLCEAADVFTQDDSGLVVPTDLPDLDVGDLLVFHDTGAYAATMASNYNSRPLAPEVLLDGAEPRLIRRRQTIDDLLELEVIGGASA